jgi:hypothetical protein
MTGDNCASSRAGNFATGDFSDATMTRKFGGCSQADLRSTGGDGLLYCFAAN